MRPFFPFYGSKWRDARRYPEPVGAVIEPFAGSAGYSTYWAPERVTLLDKDPIIAGVWRYLIRTSADEILRLPDLAAGESVDAFPLCQEAKWFIGFWLNRGSAQPKKTRTAFSTRTERQQLVWSERARERVASQLEGIRRWRVACRDYTDSPRTVATWFIDPPYQVKGRHYRYRDVDYAHLAEWSRTRIGRVIVCEQASATWLPFQPLASIKSTRGRSEEVVWTQDSLVPNEVRLDTGVKLAEIPNEEQR